MKFTISASDPLGRDFGMVGEDGTKVDGVTGFAIFGEYGGPMRASIDLMPRGINLVVEIDEVTMICPCCRTEIKHPCSEIRHGGST